MHAKHIIFKISVIAAVVLGVVSSSFAASILGERGRRYSPASSEMIDVRDYGAVCDGMTDDGPALATMLADTDLAPNPALTPNEERVWYFPGPFVTNQDIAFPSSVILQFGPNPTAKGGLNGTAFLGSGSVTVAGVVRRQSHESIALRSPNSETIVGVNDVSHLSFYARELAGDNGIPGISLVGLSQDPPILWQAYVNDSGMTSVHSHLEMHGRVNPDGSGGYPRMFVTTGLPWDRAETWPITGNEIEGYYGTSFLMYGSLQFRVPDGLQFSGLPIHADNAAATAAGLPVDAVYRTATGQLMVRY